MTQIYFKYLIFALIARTLSGIPVTVDVIPTILTTSMSMYRQAKAGFLVGFCFSECNQLPHCCALHPFEFKSAEKSISFVTAH